jgi:hypothetical protein
MANSHFKLYLTEGARWYSCYVCAFLLHHLPGIQIQEAGKLSDHVDCVLDAYHVANDKHMERFRNIPNLKIVLISGEPHGTKAGYVHLIIDCKRDVRLRPADVPFVYLPFYVVSFAERLAHPREILLPEGFGRQHAQQILASKSRFCAFMYSKDVPFRNDFFDAVRIHYKSPDALGTCKSGKSRSNTTRALYNPLVKTYYEDAVERYQSYKFVIAIENSRIDGYITEKLMNPTLARAVPIYLGAPDVFSDGVFNRKAMIHVADFPSYEACVAHIRKVDETPELYLQYLQEPLFVGNKLPHYFDSDYILNDFLRVFGQ